MASSAVLLSLLFLVAGSHSATYLPSLNGGVDGAANVAQNAVSNGRGLVNNALSSGQGLMNSALPNGQGLMNGALSSGQGLINGAMSGGQGLVNGLTSTAGSFSPFQGLRKFNGRMMDVATSAINAGTGFMKDALNMDANLLVRASTLIQSMATLTGRTSEDILNKIATYSRLGPEKAGEAIKNLLTTTASGKRFVGDWIDSKGGMLAEGLKQKSEAGINFMENLASSPSRLASMGANGLANAGTNLAGAASNFAGSASNLAGSASNLAGSASNLAGSSL